MQLGAFSDFNDASINDEELLNLSWDSEDVIESVDSRKIFNDIEGAIKYLEARKESPKIIKNLQMAKKIVLKHLNCDYK